MESLQKVFGQRVKEIRDARGFSQRELAEGTGIVQSGISGIENGRNVTLESVEKIAAFLQVEPSDLFRSEPKAEEQPDILRSLRVKYPDIPDLVIRLFGLWYREGVQLDVEDYYYLWLFTDALLHK